MAFGDSITEGKTAAGSVQILEPCLPLGDRPTSYPDVFIQMLADRYTTQALTMKPCGLGGETIAGGRTRLVAALASYPPQALLLLEGVNDLGARGADAVGDVVDGLRVMARYARGRGIEVFLGTLLPVREGGSRAGQAPPVIAQTNNQIRAVAAEEGVTLVDLYQAFGGSADPSLIDVDGLHPTLAGHRLIASTFYAAARGSLERPSSPTATMRWLSR